MASAAREYRYAHREFSTNGSLARDLDWAVRERELEHAGEVPRHERTQAAPKVYHKEQVLVRERQAIPVLSVLGVTAVKKSVEAKGIYTFLTMGPNYRPIPRTKSQNITIAMNFFELHLPVKKLYFC